MFINSKELNYSDISLLPQKCIVSSRSDCCTEVILGNRIFEMPVYPSNMKSVVDINTCKYLASHNWFYTMHRFGIDSLEFASSMLEDNYFVSISTGINDDSREDLKKLLPAKICPDYITLDVANAWSGFSEYMVKWIKDNFPETFLIVGNVATQNAIVDLEKWGADASKIGISCGKVCITKNKTGFSRPMVSTILECVSVAKNPIIADGGIVEHGDVAKAIALGADMVMAGSLFAGYDESAGKILEIQNTMYKEYFGSASEYNKNEYKNVEGKKILIPYKGSMDKLLKELKEDLRSSISYSGGNELKNLSGCPYILV